MGSRLVRMGLPGGSGAISAQMSATTTAPGQTVTLQCITPTGRDIIVNWGDGTMSTILKGNTGTTTRTYASAGTYTISISNPEVITYIDLRDTKLVLGANFLSRCSACALLRIDNISGFNSDHIKTMALTSLSLHLFAAGTYTLNSDHIKTMALTSLYLILHSASTTATITQSDWAGVVVRAVPSPTVQMGLLQAQVNAILLGIYDGFATRTATAGTLNVAGTNAAPSGTLQAACPPTTGKEAAYELVNDSCGVSTKHYAAVTITT